MERTAIELSGCIGSLYNGYRDCVLERLTVNPDEISIELKNTMSYEVINGNTDKYQNLLQMVAVDVDSRLSVLLNLVPRTGMAALMDHPHLINEYTRFFCYTYVQRIEQLQNPTTQSENLLQALKLQPTTTHLITNVDWGINIVIVLQLPTEAEKITEIDILLENIQAFMKGGNNDQRFSLDDEKLLENNVQINVYSNIPALRNMTSVLAICQYINGCSTHFNTYYPLKYLLQPIERIYPQFIRSDMFFVTVSPTLSNKLEQHLLRLLDVVKRLKNTLDYDIRGSLDGHLNEQLSQIQHKWDNFKKNYENQINQFKELIINIRCGQSDMSAIEQALNNHTQMALNDLTETLSQDVQELETKGHWIISLKNQNIKYYNVAVLNVNKEDYEKILLRELIKNNQEDRILCSNDTLNKKNPSKLTKYCEQLSRDHQTNPDYHSIYADFSYCTFELSDMMLLPSITKNTQENKYSQSIHSSTTNNIINILLLGETGVGKSTFINAFVNYLTFDTLQQAQSNKPVVVIPVSFLITTGDNFDEHTVKFGDSDALNNEDFNHPGQSVTQQCRSYIFNLDDNDKRKVRIIDTPGFGDTRGIDQDDINMKHILEYINTLPHLNAICFLFKSNTLQINNYFRICLTELLNFVGSNARENIIFCFTNARATFYSAGDTTPLLRTMLNSLQINDIPFKKANSFCFDSESFRYLVAVNDGIEFNDLDKEEYAMSWSNSATETKRLADHISRQLNAYFLCNKPRTIKHAQLMISPMVRPILETMRNLLRNIVLREMEFPRKSIESQPIIIHRPARICHSCKGVLSRMGSLWIVHNEPHEFLHKCLSCSCSSKHHVLIHYALKYDLVDNFSNYDRRNMDGMVRQLRVISNEFGYFLTHVARSTKNDPFLISLQQMIFEENNLCQTQKPNHLNLRLMEYLKQLEATYKENMNIMISSKTRHYLSDIYDWSETIHTYPDIRQQMDAIEKGQHIWMKQCEHKIPENEMKTSVQLRTIN